ncbi:MAG: polysaccharide deacetylase family protein [Planctomycetota bacterium]|nr:polysaccharide deacetylase family protein [Planctomycetota bacterium]
MSKPVASLSLDLDNKWSYLKTHGDRDWEQFPSYLDVVVPRFLDFFREHEREQRITVFVVGQDAALDKNADALASIADAGHEIGNHSFHHEPWLHLYSDDEIESELWRTEDALERVTGQRPVGFRGPGFSFSTSVLNALVRRGYEYDASTFPTFLGPLARAYYFCTSKLDAKQRQERKQLFGKFTEGFRTLRPFKWSLDAGRLIEIPVTTMPIFKMPIHVSYLLYLASYSPTLARCYFRFALGMCRAFGVGPSLLLHPLDFLGCDDESDLAFFPAMGMSGGRKVELVAHYISMLSQRFDVVTMREHARRMCGVEKSRSDATCNIPSKQS